MFYTTWSGLRRYISGSCVWPSKLGEGAIASIHIFLIVKTVMTSFDGFLGQIRAYFGWRNNWLSRFLTLVHLVLQGPLASNNNPSA